MSELDQEEKKLKVSVNMNKEDKEPEQIIIRSDDIICPKCKEPCRIAFDNLMIKLYECSNKHEINDIKIENFDDTQKIDISQIACENCNLNNKGNYENDEFFVCLTCNKNICPSCKSNHNTQHNIIKYEQKNYICQKHNEPFNYYCKDCNTNMCFACEGHVEHKIIDLEDLISNMGKKKSILEEMKKVIEALNEKIKRIIKILNGFRDFIKKFYEINNKIVSNYNVERINYQFYKT